MDFINGKTVISKTKSTKASKKRPSQKEPKKESEEHQNPVMATWEDELDLEQLEKK